MEDLLGEPIEEHKSSVRIWSSRVKTPDVNNPHDPTVGNPYLCQKVTKTNQTAPDTTLDYLLGEAVEEHNVERAHLIEAQPPAHVRLRRAPPPLVSPSVRLYIPLLAGFGQSAGFIKHGWQSGNNVRL